MKNEIRIEFIKSAGTYRYSCPYYSFPMTHDDAAFMVTGWILELGWGVDITEDDEIKLITPVIPSRH